jgi:hypothetical protein
MVDITATSVDFLPAERTVTVDNCLENNVSWEYVTNGSNNNNKKILINYLS